MAAAARYRQALPQLDGRLFVTDGGIETLLRTAAGESALRKYFRAYAEIARRHGAGCILESATWRASPDWRQRLGYDRDDLAAANRHAIRLLEEISGEYESPTTPMSSAGASARAATATCRAR